MSDVFERLALRLGVVPEYWRIDGQHVRTEPDTYRALLAAMRFPSESDAEAQDALEALEAADRERILPREIVVDADVETRRPLPNWTIELEGGGEIAATPEGTDRLPPLPVGAHRIRSGDASALLIAAPKQAPSVADLTGRARVWGVTTAIYGLRSRRNVGVGDYADLAELAEGLAAHGVDFIGVNPVHARGAAEAGISPYSPSSRTGFDTTHIAFDQLPEFATSAAIQEMFDGADEAINAARASELVNYGVRRSIAEPAIDALFDAFCEAGTVERHQSFADWSKRRSAGERLQSVFEALSLRHGPDWRSWPEPLRDARSEAVRAFAAENAREVDSHEWRQWVAGAQLDAAQRRATAAGMGLGLYLDVAVGVRPGGAETWSTPDVFAEGVSLGAPPDKLSALGQAWGLAPFTPHGLAAADYAPFRAMLATTMARAGAVRIDHIIGLARSYWAPDGDAPGGYVAYPMETLLALVRLEAYRARTSVIGEDLGTVPDGLRDAMAGSGVYGCSIVPFERDMGVEGHPIASPKSHRTKSIASFGTHDLPTIAGWWRGADIETRATLGHIEGEALDGERAARERDRDGLRRLIGGALGDAPTGEDGDRIRDGVHALLANGAAEFTAVGLDDVFDIVEQQNVPGTIDEAPNWRRRAPIAVEEVAASPALRRLGDAMGGAFPKPVAARPVEPQSAPIPIQRPITHANRERAMKDNAFEDTPEVSTAELREAIERHLTYTVGREPRVASRSDWRIALTHAVRDRVIEPWFRTHRRTYAENQKHVYYLSLEFLIGRLLEDAIANLGLEHAARTAMGALGQDLDTVMMDEPDAALGNGGLGRLAACFLDSMSTIGVPAHGYGIRYEHGLFRQRFDNGWQVEEAEDWLKQSHPWEFERREIAYRIGFGGHVENHDGDAAFWRTSSSVMALAYDTPIPGWRARWTNTLRLWSAKPRAAFDLQAFNRSDYVGAATTEVLAQTISRVLYPDDSTEAGKTLRLKQEYFFTAASIQDVLRRYLKTNDNVAGLSNYAAVQLNDTHPAIAVAELMRLLIDDHRQSFDDALATTRRVINYTNHTLLPEALERWPYDLMKEVLPRHLELMHRIEDTVDREAPGRPASTRIIDEGEVRMGSLAFVGANRVNGVSALHTDLMKETVFQDFHNLYPEKILNQTNGVTPRRWLHTCNRGLRDLLNATIGEDWVVDAMGLEALTPFAGDASFRDQFAAVKAENKRILANQVQETLGLSIDPTAMFDVQIKRIHEYKRQLMNILETIALWNAMRRDPRKEWAPRVKFFGGKAAPGYAKAKLIIKLINDVAQVVNNDPATKDRLMVVYAPNYNVTKAERLIPAADLSEQISTAGKEASGTGNMKFAMNGALTIGTLDGANVEIKDAVGEENIFIFGMTAEEVLARRQAGYDPGAAVAASPELSEVVHQIESGVFSPDDHERFRAIVDDLRHGDYFMVAADFDAYFAAQRTVDAAWGDREDWVRRAVLNTARMGGFSSDRTIRGYARDVWGVSPHF